jgi:hypothetical protein
MREYYVEYTHEPEDPDEPVRVFFVEYRVSKVYPARYADHSGPGYPAEGGEITLLDITPEPDDPLRKKIQKWIEDNHDYYQDK